MKFYAKAGEQPPVIGPTGQPIIFERLAGNRRIIKTDDAATITILDKVVGSYGVYAIDEAGYEAQKKTWDSSLPQNQNPGIRGKPRPLFVIHNREIQPKSKPASVPPVMAPESAKAVEAPSPVAPVTAAATAPAKPGRGKYPRKGKVSADGTVTAAPPVEAAAA